MVQPSSLSPYSWSFARVPGANSMGMQHRKLPSIRHSSIKVAGGRKRGSGVRAQNNRLFTDLTPVLILVLPRFFQCKSPATKS